mgnify:FL=1|jgi:hypothetical protein|tara:strand:+ start:2189 stop:2614 length:426 start_codon:yes stop_codon:yes gene_type:complete
MKRIFFIILCLIPFLVSGQKYSKVPEKYWINDNNFEEKIDIKDAFGDDNTSIVIVEFWVKFNQENCFVKWNKLKGVTYHRIDIATAPISKKKYRIRMAPTLILFVDGVKTEVFKAGLDLVLKEDLAEIQSAIDEAKLSSQF